ncbi:MAG: radical SAM protein [Deltaproteobacteria bacterium]|nr:radical SAM protein [Deltaproteobacteria bacterium]
MDAVVVGRGELAWPELLRDFAAGRLQRRYERPFGEEGFKLPQYNYALTGPDKGYNTWITQVQASLGCKFSCRFCVIPQFHGPKFVMRDLDDVVEEVAMAPTRRVLFVDDNLLNRPAWLEALCDRLRPLGKEWVAQISMDVAKQGRLIDKMAKAGCGWINVGIESLHAGTLEAQEKWQNNVKVYLETVDRIRDNGISLSTGLVLGFPHEPRDVFDVTGEFLDRANVDIAIFHLYTPYPGGRDYAGARGARPPADPRPRALRHLPRGGAARRLRPRGGRHPDRAARGALLSAPPGAPARRKRACPRRALRPPAHLRGGGGGLLQPAAGAAAAPLRPSCSR